MWQKKKMSLMSNMPDIIIRTIKYIYGINKKRLAKKNIKSLIHEKKLILLEVGAGDVKGHNGWITIDLTKKCDIYWDLRKGLPFPDESVTKIYSSHFLEHLTFKQGQAFLNDCLRVLVKGGTFSICVPNAKVYVEAYLKDKSLDSNLYFGYKPAFNNTTKIDYINYTAYMDGQHNYMFDEENLIYLLESRGFRNSRLRNFDPLLDKASRDFESIYAEAEK